jgi:uncharacterized membrane protein YdjX (TVP38/TMEM64 family)
MYQIEWWWFGCRASSMSSESSAEAKTSARFRRGGLVIFGLLAFVLLPFALFGDQLEGWAAGLMRSPGTRAAVAAIGAGLLSADILLPIPSSLVLTTLGVTLGSIAGTLVGAAGLTIGSIIGYAIGRAAERAGARRLGVGGGDPMIGRLLDTYGLAFVVACRAVPVLAEASIIAAGLARIPPRPCLIAAALANVGVAAGYASIGSWAADVSMLGAAFAASIAIPGLTLAIAAALKRTSRARQSSIAGRPPVGTCSTTDVPCE